MRRTVVYTAGLMIAAGTNLALAAPASAAPDTTGRPCCGYSNYGNANYGYSNYGHSGFQNQRPINRFAPQGGSNLPRFSPITINNQIVLNNVGNPQIGAGNYNGGGSASATNITSLFGGILGGR